MNFGVKLIYRGFIRGRALRQPSSLDRRETPLPRIFFKGAKWVSTIQSRTPEEKEKHHVTLTWKSPWKSCCTTHLPFLSSNPKILKAFPKTFPTKMKPTKMPSRRKKMRQEKRKKEGKSQDCCVTHKPQNSKISKFCFLRMRELRKLIFCICMDQKAEKCTTCRGFMVRFSSS